MGQINELRQSEVQEHPSLSNLVGHEEIKKEEGGVKAPKKGGTSVRSTTYHSRGSQSSYVAIVELVSNGTVLLLL